MKKAGTFVASVAAVSSVALPSDSADRLVTCLSSSNQDASSPVKETGSGSRRAGQKDKFAPRFDGLRFIETLVTAHR